MPIEKEAQMTLGERCDEIVRLIDETLSDVSGSTGGVGTPTFGSHAYGPEFPDDELESVLAFERLSEMRVHGTVGVAG